MTDHPKVLMAFDFGMKRIGVAVGQTVTCTATPIETVPAKAGEPQWHVIEKLIKKWQPNAFVIGIPLNMDGTDQPMSQHARHFANKLHERFHIPAHEMDERLTTKDARERLFQEGGYKALQDGQVDSIAAQLILQNWFADNV